MWLNKDVANILKQLADPITYGRLLCVSKLFYNGESNTTKLDKLRAHQISLYRSMDTIENRPKVPSAFVAFCGRQQQLKHFWSYNPKTDWRKLTHEEREEYEKKFRQDVQKRKQEIRAAREHFQRESLIVGKEIDRLVRLSNKG